VNLFDFSLQLNGFPIKEAARVLKKIQDVNESDYKGFIEAKKQEIVAFHIKHNTFYNIFASNIDVLNWNSIPIMTKKDLQKPLVERLSKGFSQNTVYVNKTSGSSGNPFVFAKDKFSHALTWAVIQNRFGWFNLDFNTSKQARFYGIPLDKKGYYKERFKDELSNRFRFSIFDLSHAAFEKHLKKFQTTPFDYINGYTSAIVQFAKFLKNKNTVLKDFCTTLKACVVTSEMLFEDDKKLMQEQFGVPVINEYGASELDLIAFENQNGHWQVNNETLFIEIIDDNGNVLPYGKEGRIVITSLYNKAHPFIRYDVGDVGILSKASTFKKPILKKLIGRTNDIVLLPSGKKAAGLTFYYITKRIIEDDGSVKEFIIEQLKVDTFKIIYVSNETLSETKKKIIINETENYLEKGLQIEFEKRKQLIRPKSGKLKQFSSYLN